MGIYLNPGDELFWQAVHSEIYVDKTGLLNYTNKVLRTSQKYLCVSRPRRFGKSMAANMVAAYYDRTADASSTLLPLLTVQNSYGRSFQIEPKTYQQFEKLRKVLLKKGIQVELDSMASCSFKETLIN